MRWVAGFIAAFMATLVLIQVNDEARAITRTVYVWAWEHFDMTGEPVPDRFK